MLDIKLIRENSQVVRENIKRRNNPEKLKQLDELIVCDKKWRKLQTKVNLLRQKRNQISLEISKLKKEGKNAKE